MRVGVITFPGTLDDVDAVRAVRLAGGEPVHLWHADHDLRGVDALVVCGMMTSMCVDATVRAAADLGFGCTVVHDACATLDLEFAGRQIPAASVHGAFLAALGDGYAAVTAADDV